jgi:hypothetical protein
MTSSRPLSLRRRLEPADHDGRPQPHRTGNPPRRHAHTTDCPRPPHTRLTARLLALKGGRFEWSSAESCCHCRCRSERGTCSRSRSLLPAISWCRATAPTTNEAARPTTSTSPQSSRRLSGRRAGHRACRGQRARAHLRGRSHRSVRGRSQRDEQEVPGNITQSYRTRHPIQIVREVQTWEGHTPEVLNGMLQGNARLRRPCPSPSGSRREGLVPPSLSGRARTRVGAAVRAVR